MIISRRFSLFFLSLLPIFVLAFALTMRPSFGADGNTLIYSVNINDTVTAGTARHVQRGIRQAERDGAAAFVILLDTPGGLVTATLDILQAMSASEVPVLTYVNPQGAIAASAGTFILLNGHIAAMSPGTTCGSAMPVTAAVPGEAPQAADQKTINFLAGHMKSIAGERGRPADLAEKFVTENLALNNAEALDKGVVDLNAASLDELLEKVNGREVVTPAGSRVLNTTGAMVTELLLNTSENLIHVVSNPTLAMILLMLGIYGLIIGFYSPGFLLPEIIGSISLILGLSGMGLFQGNLPAVLLIMLGVGLIAAELFTPTYGVLGVGGLASIILGILYFPAEPLMPRGWFFAFRSAALGVGIGGAFFVAMVVLGVSRLRRRKPVHGEAEFAYAPAWVVKELNPGGMIKIKGEIWQAFSKDGHTITEGERVRVLERQGITLIVDRIETNRN